MRARFLAYAVMTALLSGCFGEAQLQTTNSALIMETEDKSLEGFQKTVYKFAKSGTCIGCHAAGQSPFFLNKDPLIARDAVVSAGKVNFQRPELSRLYKRLAEDKHNCWGEGTLDEQCKKNAEGMLEAIYAWREYVVDYQVEMGVVTEEKPFLPGGRLPLPNGAKLFEAEAALGDVVLMPDAPCTDAQGNARICKAESIGQRFKVSEDKVAGKGLYLYVPDVARPTDALDIRMGNYVKFSFTATENLYEVYVRVAAPGNNDNDFDVQMNNQAFQTAAANIVDGSWNWQRINEFSTNAGSTNTFKIGIRDDGIKFDQILVIPNSFTYKSMGSDTFANNGALAINELIGRKVTLTYDLDGILDKFAQSYNLVNPGNTFTPDNLQLVLDITVFDEEGYKVEKAEVVPKQGSAERVNNILVRGVRFMMNQSFNPNDSDWVTVNKVLPSSALNNSYANDGDDTTVSSPQYRQISVKPMLVQKHRGALYDKVAIAFEALEYTRLNPSSVPVPPTLGTEETVYTMISTYCINCHTSFAADADRTQFVIKNASFRLDTVRTTQWLFSGIQLPNEGSPRGAAHVRRSHERMMRPIVRLPAAKGSGLAIGDGAEGSAIYRVWRYQERVPAEMKPYVDAISTGTPIANALFDKFKAFIEGQQSNPAAALYRPEVTDNVKPRLANMGGIDAGVGNGSKSFTIDFDAFDDVTRIEKVNLSVLKNSEGDQSDFQVLGDPNGSPFNGGMAPNPRRFDGEFNFNTANFGSADLRTNNFKFIAQAEDESGNLSETLMIDDVTLATPRDNIQRTIGNCDIKVGPQGGDSNNAIPNNSLNVGQAYSLEAYAQNNFGVMVGGQTVETVMTIDPDNANVSSASASANLNGRAQLPGGATFTPTNSQNGDLTVSAFNRVVGTNLMGQADGLLVDPYTCSRRISWNTNIGVTQADVAGARQIRITVTSAFRGNANVTAVSERRVNDAANYTVNVSNIVNGNDGDGFSRVFTYNWPNTSRDGNPHVFTFTIQFAGRTINQQVTAQ